MRLPSVRSRGAGLALAAATVLPLAMASCTPNADTGPKTISGTIRGAGGAYVDVMLGFDILDVQGRKIKADGSPVTDGGYGAIQRINYCLGAAGSATATPGCDAKPYSGTWSLTLPSNAFKVYVEAYPKAASNGYWINGYRGYYGPNPGDNDQSTYGMSYRREISGLSSSTGNNLVMPKVCGQPGGSTGTLWGYIYRGNTLWKATSGSTNAWSTAPNNAPILGMNEGSVDPGAGTYHITNLQGGSHYTIVATIGGITKQWLAGAQPVVNACGSTRFDLHF